MDVVPSSGSSWPAPHGVEKETEGSCPAQGSTVHILTASGHLVQTSARDVPFLFSFCFLGPNRFQFENHDEFNIDQGEPQKQFFSSEME